MNNKKHFNFVKTDEFIFSFSVRTSAVGRKSNKLNIMDCYSKILDLPSAKKILIYSPRGGMTGAAGKKGVLSRTNGIFGLLKSRSYSSFT